jgi:hypothetical protein
MEGYVYLIGNERFQWYKIGKSRTPEIRVGNLGILLPFKVQIFGVWRAKNHSLMESALHEQHATSRINGEWFTFSKQKVKDIYCSIPAEACIFWHTHHKESEFSKFSNMARDVLSPKPQPNPYPKAGIQLVEMP